MALYYSLPRIIASFFILANCQMRRRGSSLNPNRCTEPMCESLRCRSRWGTLGDLKWVKYVGLELCSGGHTQEGNWHRKERGHTILFCAEICCQGLPFGGNDHYKHRSSQLKRRHKKWAMWARASGGKALCYAFDSQCKNTSAVMLPLKISSKDVGPSAVSETFLSIYLFKNIFKSQQTEWKNRTMGHSGSK